MKYKYPRNMLGYGSNSLKVKWPNKIWLYVGPILGIGAELGQLLLIIPGTFDIMDLFLCIIASILPFFIIQIVE